MTYEEIKEKFDYLAKVGFLNKKERLNPKGQLEWTSYTNIENPIARHGISKYNYYVPTIEITIPNINNKDWKAWNRLKINNNNFTTVCNFDEISILKEDFHYRYPNVSLTYDLLIELKNKTKIMLIFYR